MTAGTFLRDIKRQFKNDRLPDIAAMLTYYAVLALFPMVVFVLTMALLIVPESTIQEGVGMLTRTMPEQAAEILSNYARSLQSTAGGGIAVITALFALWAASRAAVSLGRALNVVFGVNETRSFLRVQITGILVTLAVAIPSLRRGDLGGHDRLRQAMTMAGVA
jgi:membrane protein